MAALMIRNYCNYLPETQVSATWGCAVTALGHARIPAGSSYPPQRHPVDHHFTWERGRIIDAFQIVMITRGRGAFESSHSSGPQPIQAGSLFLLFPSIWHRYAPDPAVGWTEQWIECRGQAFNSALASKALDPDHPIRPANRDFTQVFAQIHGWAARDPMINQGVISALGLQLLALLLRDVPVAKACDDAALVQRAMTIMQDRCHKPLSLPLLAKTLKVGYTRFRMLFRTYAHTSPKQYLLRVRMELARDLLRNTDKSVKEVAQLLGFHSSFHFSRQFRAMQGCSPRVWRQQLISRMAG